MVSIHGVGLGVGWGRAGLPRSFGNFSDGGFEDFQLGVGRADGNSLFFDPDNNANDAAVGHNFIASF